MNSKKLARIELNFYKRLGSTFNKKRKYLKYRLFSNSEKYFIYKHIGGRGKIIAAYGNVVCTKENDTTIRLYPNYKNTFIKYTIKLNRKRFPGLLPNSKIDICFVLPYCRKCDKETIIDSWRLVVVTNRCQVFHNFPCRSTIENEEGLSRPLDIVCFDESVVWDLPNKKYPSEKKDCDISERYFPGFSKETYEYHPAINGTKKNKYGNLGFPKYKALDNGSFLGRFYFPNRTTDSNPFFYLNGLEVDSKITLVGTYRSNTKSCCRIVVLATIDGGRNWYAKYEFSDYGDYSFKQGNIEDWGNNHGKPINGDGLVNFNNKEMWLIKRGLSLEHDSKKYQTLSSPIKIKEIKNSNPLHIVTEQNHNLKTGNLVAVCSNDNPENANYILNNEITEDSSGNGLLFKVVSVSNNEVMLYENVSNTENALPCRHIHFIDRHRDGWTIGTGEIYPNGWILFMESPEGDTYSPINIEKPFVIKQLSFDQRSVQRAMGFYFFEREKENYAIYASDHDLLFRDCHIGKNSIQRNSTGVFVGKASDTDDYKKTKPIFETNEPCLFFKLINGTFIFGGQRGLLAFGHNYGERWESIKIEGALKRWYGETFDFIVIENYLFLKK